MSLSVLEEERNALAAALAEAFRNMSILDMRFALAVQGGSTPSTPTLFGTYTPVNEESVSVQGINRVGGVAPFFYEVVGGTKPAFVVLDDETGDITITTVDGSAGTYAWDLQVTDANGAQYVLPVELIINDSVVAPPPVFLTGAPNSTNEGGDYTFTPTITGGTAPFVVTVSVGGPLDSIFTLTAATGATRVQPADGDDGTYNYTYLVTDAEGETDTLAVSFVINNSITAGPPVLSGVASAVNEGQAFSFVPVILGGVAPVTVAIVSGSNPSWANAFNTTTGAITGTPLDGDDGTAVIGIQATGADAQVSNILLVTVEVVDVVPPEGRFDAYYAGSFALNQTTTFLSRPSRSRPATKSPDWASESYLDARFGTRVYRATDMAGDTPNSLTFLRHEYSRRQAFNADSTRRIAMGSNGFIYLYNALTNARIDGGCTIAGGVGAMGAGGSFNLSTTREAIWHPTDPDLIWHSQASNGDLIWREFNIVSKASSVLFTISASTLSGLGLAGVTKLRMKGEGRPSNDGRYWSLLAFAGSTYRGFIMYDKQTGTVLGAVPGTLEPNWIGSSPSGDYCVPSWSSGLSLTRAQAAVAGVNATNGTRAYNRATIGSTKTFQQLSNRANHADFGYSTDGDEMYVSVHYDAALMPAPVVDGGVYMARLSDGQLYDLPVHLYSGDSHAIHFSGLARNRPSVMLCGTYGSASSGGSWYLDETIFALELRKDGTGWKRRIAHHQGRTGTAYWYENHPTWNYDGDMIIFHSNFGGSNYEDYLIGLPSWAVGESLPAPVSVYPVVESVTEFLPVGTNVTTRDIPIASGVVAGDLLGIIWACDGADSSVTPSGWTRKLLAPAAGSNFTGYLYTKVAVGTEGGTNVTITSASERGSAIMFRIQAGTHNGLVETLAGSEATGVNPDPPSLTPTFLSGGSGKFLAIAGVYFNQGLAADPSVYPYAGDPTYAPAAAAASTNDATVAACWGNIDAASVNPSTFTAASTTYIPFTIAIQGATA